MSERTDHGFRSGAIEVSALVDTPHGSAVEVKVGNVVIEVLATPKGRRAYVTIQDHPARTASGLHLSVFTRGRWWQP